MEVSMATEVWSLKHLSQQTSTHEGITVKELKEKVEHVPTLLKKSKKEQRFTIWDLNQAALWVCSNPTSAVRPVLKSFSVGANL